ncbi:MalY/PatB family protein [Paenisporosarcina sp. TG-14]|uniref:MalY/PatB family protein n=1 Tax=Paenisporosarcina sp. TG-14 TaxID=1231057 RepID=UPI000308B93F|nr:MalY/PatB family protein [Paenisporosarcina sp. TG-14]
MTSFKQVIDRSESHSIKWDFIDKVYKIEDASDILPMWVADMDFAAPQAVIDALLERIKHPIFGYSYMDEGSKTAVQNWLLERHGWQTQNEWMLFHHGVVPAIASVIESFTQKGDLILITPPVYQLFFSIPQKQGRQVVESSLIEEKGQYKIDFVSFEKQLKQGVKLFILCNPHNPGGMVWPKETLQEIIRLCAKYDTLILSDEIHGDLVFPKHKHIPLATLAGEEVDRIITCVAPSKTFNLAGIQAAVIIATDSKKREKLKENALAHGQMELSSFAAVALTAAYEDGGAWLDELLKVLSSNIDYAIEKLTKAVPGLKIEKPQATYLLWIDYRGTEYSENEIMDLLLNKGKLALEPGSKYGDTGRGFLRMNVACPRSTLEDGVSRFITALE